MTIPEKEQEEKKDSRLKDIAGLVGLTVSFLVAGTSLFSNSEKIPLWWFQLSFIILIFLTVSMPIVIFSKPISKRIQQYELKRKRNAVSRKYFSEFKDLVWKFRNFNNSINDIKKQFEESLWGSIRILIG